MQNMYITSTATYHNGKIYIYLMVIFNKFADSKDKNSEDNVHHRLDNIQHAAISAGILPPSNDAMNIITSHMQDIQQQVIIANCLSKTSSMNKRTIMFTTSSL